MLWKIFFYMLSKLIFFAIWYKTLPFLPNQRTIEVKCEAPIYFIFLRRIHDLEIDFIRIPRRKRAKMIVTQPDGSRNYDEIRGGNITVTLNTLLRCREVFGDDVMFRHTWIGGETAFVCPKALARFDMSTVSYVKNQEEAERETKLKRVGKYEYGHFVDEVKERKEGDPQPLVLARDRIAVLVEEQDYYRCFLPSYDKAYQTRIMEMPGRPVLIGSIIYVPKHLLEFNGPVTIHYKRAINLVKVTFWYWPFNQMGILQGLIGEN